MVEFLLHSVGVWAVCLKCAIPHFPYWTQQLKTEAGLTASLGGYLYIVWTQSCCFCVGYSSLRVEPGVLESAQLLREIIYIVIKSTMSHTHQNMLVHSLIP